MKSLTEVNVALQNSTCKIARTNKICVVVEQLLNVTTTPITTTTTTSTTTTTTTKSK